MLRTVALLALVAVLCPTLTGAEPPLRTVAETSAYKKTSTSAEVLAFCEAVAKRSPNATLHSFGTTHGGRKLPLLVIADPPVATVEEAKKSGKLVVLAFANIHAGEVDGKEALLAFARVLTDKKNHPLLKDLIILLVPNLNADGNDAFGANNRPGQNGPLETGTRHNAQNLDLNRDFVKLESPEIRALVKLVDTWNPAMVIDCHTTNGSKHRHTLTYDGPRYPSTADLAIWTDGTLFPAVTKKVKTATGFDIAPYGNFSKDRTKWETYPAAPRYSTQYFALCGRVGILSESYSYASFKDRIEATQAFVTACFEVAAVKRKELAKLVAPAKPTRVPLRTKTEAFPDKIPLLGFVEVEKDGKRVATDKHKVYALDYLGRVVPTAFAELPFAYLVPANHVNVIENLQRHGVKVEELREDIELEVEAFGVTSVDTRAYGIPKRTLVTDVSGAWKKANRRVPAGSVLVKTAQPHGALAAYLLEPRAEDGLTTWDFFSKSLVAKKDFAILRLPKAYPMVLGAVRPLPESVLANKPITDSLLFARGGGFSFGFAGSPVTVGAWLDGEHFLQVKGGKLLKVEARTGKVMPFTDPAKIRKSLAAFKTEVPLAVAEKIASGTSFQMNPARTAFLFDLGGDLGLAFFDGTPAVRLTDIAGRREHVTFSPDGKRVAFVRRNNLFAVEVAKPAEKQLTTDGGTDIFNATSDWVYEEEIFNRSGRAYWWSPDGKQVAFLRFDDTPVKKFNLVGLDTPRGPTPELRVPEAGRPEPDR